MVDADQRELLAEDEDDAWDAVIRFLGGYKKVGSWLWPHLKGETAYARLKNCFNDSKDEKLSWVDGRRLMKRAREEGCHLVMYRLCDDLLYERPKTITKEKAKAELQSQLEVSLQRIEDQIRQLKNLDNK